MTIFDQMLLRGMAPNSEAVARASSGGIFGGPGITQNQGGQGNPQTMGAGLPAQAGFASTPNDPYAPWMRPDIAPHTQNILPLMQPLEQEGFRQLQETYGPDAPTPQELNPLAFRGFGAQPFSPMNFPNQYNIPKYSHDMGMQQNIDAGEQFWDFAGQEPFAEYQSLAPFAGGALATGGSGAAMGSMPARPAGGPAAVGGQAGMQYQPQPQPQPQPRPGLPVAQAGGQMPAGLGGGAPAGGQWNIEDFRQTSDLKPVEQPITTMPGDLEQSQRISAFAQNAPEGMGDFLSAWQTEPEPNTRAHLYQLASGLYNSLDKYGLEGTRQRVAEGLRPVDTQFGKGLWTQHTGPERDYLGGVANDPGEQRTVGTMFNTRNQLYRTLLGEGRYNELMGSGDAQTTGYKSTPNYRR